VCGQEISREFDLKGDRLFILLVRNQEIGACISGWDPEIDALELSLDVATDHELPGVNCEQWPHLMASNNN